jgi:hypothetical protein
VRFQKRTGAGLKLLFIRNHEGTFQLNMHTNDGAKYGPKWAKAAERRLVTPGPQGDPKIFLKGVSARRIGRETVNGRAAEVWTYNLPEAVMVSDGPGKPAKMVTKPLLVRLYLDAKEQRPLKVETQMQLAQGTGRGRVDTVSVEYTKYRWGFPLQDSFFNLPRGAKWVDLTQADPP